jgi:hypothetical protein
MAAQPWLATAEVLDDAGELPDGDVEDSPPNAPA